MRVHPVIPLHIIKALLGYILRAALSIDIYFPIFLHHFPSVTQNQRTIKKKRSPVDPKRLSFFYHPGNSLDQQQLRICRAVEHRNIPLFRFAVTRQTTILPMILFISKTQRAYPSKDIQQRDIRPTRGESSTISQLVYPNALKNEADYLKQLLLEEHGLIVQHTKQGNMQFTLSNWIPHPEGYRLTVNEQGIRIEGSTPQGVFYGLQTFRQLITTHQGQIRIPYVVIDDAPAFKWRSFMLDDGRAFKGMKEVKQLLDEMAILKMNTFHWHLTEDQGWRIEIKKYPLLTEIGAHRDSTQLNWYESKVFDGKPFDGYYTQREIKEIVSYARNLHITVVPEIEMPGHASAAIAAYPWLGSTDEKIKVPCTFGVKNSAFNVADPRTRTFLKDVLDEVMELFPSRIIHIGGDEVRQEQWNNSSEVRTFMKEKGLNSAAELQMWFTNHIASYLKSKGRIMMGWNDITGDKLHGYQSEVTIEAGNQLSEDATEKYM